MPAFQYAALDEGGRTRKGLLEGDTPRQVRQLLRERGLTPLTVDEVAAQEQVRGSRGFRLGRKIIFPFHRARRLLSRLQRRGSKTAGAAG